MKFMRFLALLLLLAASGAAQTLTPVWIELGANGQNLARVIVESVRDCPSLTADKKALPMSARTPIPEGFKPECEAQIPADTQTLRYGSKRLRLPKTPNEVVIVGDTGCRVKGKLIQDCADQNLWPLQSVADRIARSRPDLIVHVGDYLYRESVCPDPAKGCEGPHGDNWPAWNADFFSPAAAALASAPWAFSRGNHEDCKRSWRGWFYYLDPRPYTGKCEEYSEPYIVASGELKIGMLDSASTAEDIKGREQIMHYTDQLARFSGKVNWIADHHPFWAYKSDPITHKLSVVSQPLDAAWEQAKPQGVQLILSGHIHLFEFLGFESGRPSQIVAGDGGTDLADSVKADFSGENVSGAAVNSGMSRHEFGFTVLRRVKEGWQLTLKSAKAQPLIACNLPSAGLPTCRSQR
jgi:hypothetical protein